MSKKYDFGGYATKFGVMCSDGRIIDPEAFRDCDGDTVPIVYQHVHNDIDGVLGHGDLEIRDDGVYIHGKFNSTAEGNKARELVQCGDLNSLSIFANQLVQRGSTVMHGVIREVSLVLAGANPEARIDNLAIAHADGTYDELDDEAVINFDLGLDYLAHADDGDDDSESGGGEKTIKEIFDTLTDEQKEVVNLIVGQIIAEYEGDDDEEESDEEVAQSDIEEGFMKKNVFSAMATDGPTMSHDAFVSLMDRTKALNSFKKAFAELGKTQQEAFLAHAGETYEHNGITYPVKSYGISNIGLLFPDAHELNDRPEWIKRDTSWVAGALAGMRHVPYSRIKTSTADITPDEARARGYITGDRKESEVFRVMYRTTNPTTVYKKQEFDRDDVLDTADPGFIGWIQSEMDFMIREEIARACLVGDGRSPSSRDHIDDECIRPIWTDDDVYTMKCEVNTNASTTAIMEAMLRAQEDYEGSGNLTFFTTKTFLNDMLLVKDLNQHRLYNTIAEVANAIGVDHIVTVPILKGLTRTITPTTGDPYTANLLGIIVDLRDYAVGTDRGGQLTSFEDFDIDYNKQKYLLETRMSGCLTKYHSAIAVETSAVSQEGL